MERIQKKREVWLRGSRCETSSATCCVGETDQTLRVPLYVRGFFPSIHWLLDCHQRRCFQARCICGAAELGVVVSMAVMSQVLTLIAPKMRLHTF